MRRYLKIVLVIALVLLILASLHLAALYAKVKKEEEKKQSHPITMDCINDIHYGNQYFGDYCKIMTGEGLYYCENMGYRAALIIPCEFFDSLKRSSNDKR